MKESINQTTTIPLSVKDMRVEEKNKVDFDKKKTIN